MALLASTYCMNIGRGPGCKCFLSTIGNIFIFYLINYLIFETINLKYKLKIVVKMKNNNSLFKYLNNSIKKLCLGTIKKQQQSIMKIVLQIKIVFSHKNGIKNKKANQKLKLSNLLELRTLN